MAGVTSGVETRVRASQALERLYRAVEMKDSRRVRDAFRADAFVLTPTADGVLTSADPVVDDIRRWIDAVDARGGSLRLRSDTVVAGSTASTSAVWVFDHIVADAVRDGATVCSVPIRLTALLVPDDDWRIAAAYWSVPFGTQQEQDGVKHAGALEPGQALSEAVSPEAQPLVDQLVEALRQPRLLPGLYSTGDDHVTIGSVTDEVFLGPAGCNAWTEFVQYVTAFVPRGAMRAALVGSDAAWMAANIDIGEPPTPYRFFYVWIRGADSGWRIAVSHDAVSRNPLTT
jgi:hypothetical protein